MNDKEIIKLLRGLYGDQILAVDELPKAYILRGVSSIKAIYLGCDPSNKDCTKLPYVFTHDSGLENFTQFRQDHTLQLNQIGLGWEDVYTQNLCRNYFKDETAKNPIWERVAKEFWIERLKEELSCFENEIPVLLTAQVLLKVLGTDGYEKILAPEFYECRFPIPVPASKNKLKRELIPMYRGKSPRFNVSYQLRNERWSQYRNSILSYFKKLDSKK